MTREKVFRVLLEEKRYSYVDVEASNADEAMAIVGSNLRDGTADPTDVAGAGPLIDSVEEIAREDSDLAD
jgi:hypothetical protein